MIMYSTKMQDIFRQAQFQAARFDSHCLETWHVLLAMVAVDNSLANMILSEYDAQVAIEEYEAAAILAMGKTPKEQLSRVDFRPQSKTLTNLLAFAQAIAKSLGIKKSALSMSYLLFY